MTTRPKVRKLRVSGDTMTLPNKFVSASNKFLSIVAGLFVVAIATTAALAQSPQYDLLLKGGHVIDPANKLDAVMDVAISKDKIAAVAKDIPADKAGNCSMLRACT